jgi:hypothetical protein
VRSDYDELRETALQFEESSERLLDSNLALQRLVHAQEAHACIAQELGFL